MKDIAKKTETEQEKDDAGRVHDAENGKLMSGSSVASLFSAGGLLTMLDMSTMTMFDVAVIEMPRVMDISANMNVMQGAMSNIVRYSVPVTDASQQHCSNQEKQSKEEAADEHQGKRISCDCHSFAPLDRNREQPVCSTVQSAL
jgi:hypothetical protein